MMVEICVGSEIGRTPVAVIVPSARVVSGSSPASGVARAHSHEMRHVDGAMCMRRKGVGLAVPAGAKVELAPGGGHLMLIGPKQPLVEGDVVVASLRFAAADDVEVAFRVRGLGVAREVAHHAH